MRCSLGRRQTSHQHCSIATQRRRNFTSSKKILEGREKKGAEKTIKISNVSRRRREVKGKKKLFRRFAVAALTASTMLRGRRKIKESWKNIWKHVGWREEERNLDWTGLKYALVRFCELLHRFRDPAVRAFLLSVKIVPCWRHRSSVYCAARTFESTNDEGTLESQEILFHPRRDFAVQNKELKQRKKQCWVSLQSSLHQAEWRCSCLPLRLMNALNIFFLSFLCFVSPVFSAILCD